MSTHNIGFNEDLIKIIFQLSSNIIKYGLISSSAVLFYTLLKYNEAKVVVQQGNTSLFEPRSEKTGLRGFRPCPTQTGLYGHRRWPEA